MDSDLNDSVIRGTCVMCKIHKEKIAKLEGQVAEAQRWAVAANTHRQVAEFIADDEARVRRHSDVCLERVGHQLQEAKDQSKLAWAWAQVVEDRRGDWCRQALARGQERDRWRGMADCREFDGFLGPTGQPECQGGDKIPSEPMCLTHRLKVCEGALIEPINDYRGFPTLRGCRVCHNLWKKGGPEKHFKDCVLAEEEPIG